MIVHRMYKTNKQKKTTATLGADYLRLYPPPPHTPPPLIVISKLYKLLIWLQSFGTTAGSMPHPPNYFPGFSSSFVAPYRVHR